jgi:hypothetical protein
MKPLLSVLIAFVCFRTSAQTFQLENLTYGKKDGRFVFAGENFFRFSSKEPISTLEYDHSLANIDLRNDSLIIHVIYSVNIKQKKSNWDGKNELEVAFILKNGDRIYVPFFYKNLPYAFASIAAQPARAKVDKASIIKSGKVEISITGPDTEGFFANYKVQKFQLSVNDKTFELTGDQLSDEAVSAIALAQSGDTLTLRNVDSFDDVTKKNLRFIPTIYFLK